MLNLPNGLYDYFKADSILFEGFLSQFCRERLISLLIFSLFQPQQVSRTLECEVMISETAVFFFKVS